MQVRYEGDKRVADVSAGGGITIASVAAREIEEAVWKADALLSAAGWGSPRSSTRGRLRITPLRVPQGAPLGGRLGQARAHPHGAVVLVDNLDSFTHNRAHASMQLGHDVHVVQGRGPRGPPDIDDGVRALLEAAPSHIVLGPGPGRPEEAAFSMRLAELALRGQAPPLLGVCLGHQALGLAAGGRITPDPHGPVHGRPVQIVHDGSGLFRDVSGQTMRMVRYKSLVVECPNLRVLVINARYGHVTLGVRSPRFNVHGLQGILNPSAAKKATGSPNLPRCIAWLKGREPVVNLRETMPLCRSCNGTFAREYFIHGNGPRAQICVRCGLDQGLVTRKTFHLLRREPHRFAPFCGLSTMGALDHDSDGMDPVADLPDRRVSLGHLRAVLLGLGTLLLPAQILLYRAKYSGDMARLTLLMSARKATGHVLAWIFRTSPSST